MQVGQVLIAGMLIAGPALAQSPGKAHPQEPNQASQAQSDARMDMQRAKKDAQAAQKAARNGRPLKAKQFQADSRIESKDARMHQQESGKGAH